MIVVLSLSFAFYTIGFAQDELPPVPTFTPQSYSSTDTLPPLPGDSAPAPNNASISSPSAAPSNANVEITADQQFQANFRKPFVGQVHGFWPPSFETVHPVSAQTTIAANSGAPIAPSVPELPTLPNEPEKASVNPPVAQVPVIGVPGSRQYQPNRSANPYQPAQNPSVPPIPQNQPYSSPTIAPVQPPQAFAPVQPPQTSVSPVSVTTPQSAPVQAQKSEYMFKGGSICPLNIRQTQPGEHPMSALIPWATEGLQTFNSKIKDYSCVMIKRERIDGQLQESSTLYMKIREQPFSIYVKYLKPDRRAGVEALYRKGYHNDQLLGHDVGFKAMAGSLWLDPNGRLAMAGQKYPITDGGIPNLVRKMMETVKLDMKNDPEGKETFVKFVEDGGEIDGRPCIRVDVMHPVKRSCYRFHRAEIYLDKEWGIPVRYAAWMWPAYQGGKPVLDEEFTYTKLQFNRGFTDWDFNEKNREYRF